MQHITAGGWTWPWEGGRSHLAACLSDQLNPLWRPCSWHSTSQAACTSPSLPTVYQDHFATAFDIIPCISWVLAHRKNQNDSKLGRKRNSSWVCSWNWKTKEGMCMKEASRVKEEQQREARPYSQPDINRSLSLHRQSWLLLELLSSITHPEHSCRCL